MTDDLGFEVARIISDGPSSEGMWPVVGPETLELRASPQLAALGEAADTVIEEARRVLQRSGQPDPTRPRRDVGLVTGYVQSGKTLSFTTVCALARDNGFPLVIVIAGSSTSVLGQSDRRLQRDLRLLTRPDRKWLHVPIDLRAQSPAQRVKDALLDWEDAGVTDSRRQAVLITVMKNYHHLVHLVRTLRELDLGRVPTLVIDDEGDQASLNYLVNRGRESTTYHQIGQLRSLLPIHTYLQYTATPQAPLLINLIDALSPSFAEVLTPGPGYTGGLTFFPPNDPQASSRYVRTIPAADIFGPGQTLAEPPLSFRLALATFFVGVAAGEILEQGAGNRSMMVHPHQTRALHADYFVWAESLKADWQRALSARPGDESRDQATALLRAGYDDLAATAQDLPAWEDVLREMPRTIRRTAVWRVNAERGETPSIPWRERYAHILVGGQAMDRGFTVEGLTVTYMPRGLGGGNADTIQQRARFYGYKTRYLGYCRVWLEQVVRDALTEYVEHEESMRSRLLEHSASGRPLREWKRAFFLDRHFHATRRQVVSVAYSRGNHGERWVDPASPHELQEVIEHNNAAIDRFVATLSLQENEGDPRRTSYQRHLVAHDLRLRTVYEQLLQELRLPSPGDSLQHTALLLQLDRWLEERPDASCSLYVMAPGAPKRQRTLLPSGELGNFYQGANPSAGPEQGSIYPGDREIRHASDVTIQVHTLELLPDSGAEDQTTYPRVCVIATFVPRSVGRDWVVQ